MIKKKESKLFFQQIIVHSLCSASKERARVLVHILVVHI